MSQLENIIANLRKVHDPEISVNIYDLGLIYDIDLSIKILEMPLSSEKLFKCAWSKDTSTILY